MDDPRRVPVAGAHPRAHAGRRGRDSDQPRRPSICSYHRSMGWQGVAAGWEPILDRLRGEGLRVELTSVAYPVQLEGVLPDGQPFYFRERGGHCYLGVGGQDPVDSPAWNTTEYLRHVGDDPSTVGFLEPSDAYELITRLLGRR